jgi:TPR repeat protein
VELFTKAAEMGNPQAQYCLGMCYLDGTGVSYNREIAIQWLQKAAQQGLPAAKAQLGL